jgi:hypothetical protein
VNPAGSAAFAPRRVKTRLRSAVIVPIRVQGRPPVKGSTDASARRRRAGTVNNNS